MKKQVLTITLLLLTNFCRAQANAGGEIVSVDMFTGIGSVNIPIHAHIAGDLDFSVSLSYNAKGVTVDELASSVGLGWSLIAGGNITREVRSVEDEVCIPATFTNTYGYTQTMTDTLQGMLVPGLFHPTYSGETRYDDVEPDVFTLNLGSRTVQFSYKYNSPTPVYITDPRSEIKIELFTKDFVNGSYTNVRNGVVKHISEDSMKNILSFIVTDERGNKFYFERGDYERKWFDLNRQYGVDTGIYYPTQKWNLQRAVTINGEEVVFHYISKYVENIVSREERWTNEPNNSFPLEIKDHVWKGWKTHISKIEFPGKTEVEFDLDAGINGRCDCEDFRLKNIIIKSEHGPVYKNSTTYKLNQAYFNTPAAYITNKELPLTSTCGYVGNGFWNFPPNYPQWYKTMALDTLLRSGIRLKLKSIDRIGTDNITTQQYYSFDYNDAALPYRFSASKDYFGYHNGKIATPYIDYYAPPAVTYYLSIPFNTDLNFGIDRTDDFIYTQSFVLNKITNGLGGITTITYKDYNLVNPPCSYGNLALYPYPHIPSHPNNIHCNIDTKLEGDTVNDGLIVWKISTSDQFNQEANSTTEYTYKEGKRFFRGGYTSYSSDNTQYSPYIYTNNFCIPPNLFHGSNHGFDTTIITVTGYNDEWISKRKFTFSNLMYFDASYNYVSCINLPTGDLFHFALADFKKFRMGLPLRSDVYDEHDNVISTQTSRYRFIANTVEVWGSSHARGPQAPANPALDNFGIPAWPFRVLDYETALQDSSTTIRYELDPIGPTKTFVTSYQYQHDVNNNIRRVLWRDSKGQTFKKYHGYNYHYNSGAGINSLNSLGLQYMISNEVWKVDGADSLLLSYTLNVPNYDLNYYALTFPNSYATVLNAPLSSSNANNVNYINKSHALIYGHVLPVLGWNFKKVKEITLYDDKHKVLESKVPGENIYEATIWDMDFNNIIAEVKNAKYEDIAYSSFEGIYDFQSSYYMGNLIFDPSAISLETDIPGLFHALTGKHVYTLEQGNNPIESYPLKDRPYILSYWSHAPNPGAIFQIELFDNNNNSILLNPTLHKTVGQWKFYAVQFTPSAAQSHLEIYNQTGTIGADMYIDELRIYPPEASMRTTTYKPLFGVGSACDENNQVTYFEYDAFGSVKIERDMYGNITTKTEYVNKESSTNPNPPNPVLQTY